MRRRGEWVRLSCVSGVTVLAVLAGPLERRVSAALAAQGSGGLTVLPAFLEENNPASLLLAVTAHLDLGVGWRPFPLIELLARADADLGIIWGSAGVSVSAQLCLPLPRGLRLLMGPEMGVVGFAAWPPASDNSAWFPGRRDGIRVALLFPVDPAVSVAGRRPLLGLGFRYRRLGGFGSTPKDESSFGESIGIDLVAGF